MIRVLATCRPSVQLKCKVKRALISVSDKTGLEDLAMGLHRMGSELLASGGTARAIRQAHVPVREVADFTGFPELMGGRVKTLHPRVHGGILARRDADIEAMREHDIAPIDLVVVNLYPFESVVQRPGVTRAEAIEHIDIGGPAMLRSAAKNHAFVTVVTDPADYGRVLAAIAQGGPGDALRAELAIKAFARSGDYDQAITRYFSRPGESREESDAPPAESRTRTHTDPPPDLELVSELRYGENPHQRAELYRDTRLPQEGTLVAGKQLQGKALSYNNLMDADAALACLRRFDDPCCVIVKHATPCGVACADTIGEAWQKAFDSDPVSAFGGIIAVNRALEEDCLTRILRAQFVEVLVAPEISAGARHAARRSRNLRLLAVPSGQPDVRGRRYQRVSGGMLIQDEDSLLFRDGDLQVVTERSPSDAELQDLLFAFKVVAAVKSNAIVIARDARTLGIGGGQPNRVTSARIALLRADELRFETRGSVLASDAFLPFRDTVDLAAEHGVSAIIQPGGSMRDNESIEAANAHGMAMLFTGYRHFRH